MIRPYLSDIINDHKTPEKWQIHSPDKVSDRKNPSEWKVQLTVALNFISSKDSDESRTMMGSETDEIIEEIFKSFLQKYQEGLEESMRGSEFVFGSVDALYYKLNKIIYRFSQMAKK